MPTAMSHQATSANKLKAVYSYILFFFCRKLGSFGKGNENRAKYKEKCIFSLSKTCSSPVFFVSLHLEKAVAASCKPTPKALRFKSFGGRRKIFARPLQDIAPPAATICHGRGKLVTCRLFPCYIPCKSLFPRGLFPFILLVKKIIGRTLPVLPINIVDVY